MLGLLFTILATVVVFWLVLVLLGGAIGTPELLIWTVLLVAAVTAEVVYFRRRGAPNESR